MQLTKVQPLTIEFPKNDQSSEKHNLHQILMKMFLLAQIFGYLPIQGITGPDYRSLKYTWQSFRVYYTIFTISGALFVTIMQMNKIIRNGLDILEADRLCFNAAGFISGILFLKFAKNWPKLMKDWSLVEISMINYGWPKGLNRKLTVLIIIFMGMALVEYILSQSNKIVLAFDCKENTKEALIYFFGNMSYSHTFKYVNFNYPFGIILQITNLQLVFSWTFIDLFIMVISTALASRFSQITMKLQVLADAKVAPEIIWRNIRDDYNRLCKLCRKIDDEISYIVLLAFANDLFFILVQLFNSLRPVRNGLERIYFYFSFSLLIIRTICLCLFGAKVNDESKTPLTILNIVPSNIYNLEVQRFIHQIGTSEVAITGMNFFSITRGLILSIAGAIVTYELVLIQFNDNLLKKSIRDEGSNGCSIFA